MEAMTDNVDGNVDVIIAMCETWPHAGVGQCPFLMILNITFKYSLEIISPIVGPIVGWCVSRTFTSPYHGLIICGDLVRQDAPTSTDVGCLSSSVLSSDVFGELIWVDIFAVFSSFTRMNKSNAAGQVAGPKWWPDAQQGPHLRESAGFPLIHGTTLKHIDTCQDDCWSSTSSGSFDYHHCFGGIWLGWSHVFQASQSMKIDQEGVCLKIDYAKVCWTWHDFHGQVQNLVSWFLYEVLLSKKNWGWSQFMSWEIRS